MHRRSDTLVLTKAPRARHLFIVQNDDINRSLFIVPKTPASKLDSTAGGEDLTIYIYIYIYI